MRLLTHDRNWVVLLSVACSLVAGCASSAATDSAGTGNFAAIQRRQVLVGAFPSSADAITRGEQFEAAITAADATESSINSAFQGKAVVILGVAPSASEPGDMADLYFGESALFHLKVLLDTTADVRPQAAYYSACVLGIVRSVDLKRRMVTVEVKEQNWVSVMCL